MIAARTLSIGNTAPASECEVDDISRTATGGMSPADTFKMRLDFG